MFEMDFLHELVFLVPAQDVGDVERAVGDGGRLEIRVQVEVDELGEVSEEAVLNGLDQQHLRARLGEDRRPVVIDPPTLGLNFVELRFGGRNNQ